MVEGPSDGFPEMLASEAISIRDKIDSLRETIKLYTEARQALQEAFDETSVHIDGRTELADEDPSAVPPLYLELREARGQVFDLSEGWDGWGI